ncbi:MAG: hypothetical protein ACE5FL_09785 [Myxococcota bacterium]
MRVGSVLAVLLLIVGVASAGQDTVGGPVPPYTPPSGEPGKTLRDQMERETPEKTREGVEEKSPDEILDEFKSAYRAIGSARLSIYLNRKLSDDVREWNVVLGITRAESEATARTSDETAELTEQMGSGEMQIHSGPAPDGSRSSPRETWMWEFEHGFMKPFLETRCRLIDRATILRLTAADAVRPGEEYAIPATKRIETQALRGHVDVFIELLVTRSASSPHGYEFRATAKEVDKGQILADVTSLGRESRRVIRVRGDGYEIVPGRSRPSARELFVTDHGYEVVDKLPTVGEASRELALQLMQELAYSWQ